MSEQNTSHPGRQADYVSPVPYMRLVVFVPWRILRRSILEPNVSSLTVIRSFVWPTRL